MMAGIEKYVDGSKAKGQIPKWMFQENKTRQNFPKNQHFLPPDKRIRG